MMKPARHTKTTPPVAPAYAVSLVLVLAVVICYQQVRGFDFIVLDDPAYVADNRNVSEGFTRPGLNWAFTSIQVDNWHPITWLSHMLDCHLFGTRPGAHHLVNVFFHLFNSLLLFYLLKQMTHEVWPSSMVAVIFAMHPINVESVAWVAERKNLLSTFFGFLTLLAYLRYTKAKRLLTYLPVACCLSLGLMAKPMIVTLPFVMLLLDYWPLNRFSLSPGTQTDMASHPFRILRKLIAEKVPLFILSAASCVITLYAQKQGGAVTPVHALSLTARLSNAVVAYADYVKKMIWPENLAVLYPHPISIPPSRLVFAVLFIGGITLFCIIARRRHPHLFVGWFWFVGTLVPMIGVVQVGVQAMADRYLYIAMIGFFMMLIWGAKTSVSRRRIGWKIPSLAAAALLSMYMAVTWRQVGYWQDSIKLFTRTLSITEDNYVAHNSLGFALHRIGKTEAALLQYRRSIAIHPVFDAPHLNMGTIFYAQGRLDAALYHFSEAIRINPKNAEAYNNKGAIHAIYGERVKAVRHYTEAIRLNPVYADAHRNLGNVLLARGDYPLAIYHYQVSIDIDSRNKYVHNDLGIALAAVGKRNEAISHFLKAVQLDPNFIEANHNLKRMTSGSNPENTESVKGEKNQ